jgi:hypothetical protein
VQKSINSKKLSEGTLQWTLLLQERMAISLNKANKMKYVKMMKDERGDVPGWVLVVLMTTGLVTAIWTIAAPRLSAILKNSLDAMNGIR